jgi:hypothetical protein
MVLNKTELKTQYLKISALFYHSLIQIVFYLWQNKVICKNKDIFKINLVYLPKFGIGSKYNILGTCTFPTSGMIIDNDYIFTSVIDDLYVGSFQDLFIELIGLLIRSQEIPSFQYNLVQFARLLGMCLDFLKKHRS